MTRFNERLRFHVINRLFFDRDALLVVKDTPEGPVVGKIVWEKRTEGFMLEHDDAVISGPRGTLDDLAHALAEAGVHAKDATAELRATKGWLEDMRALVFKSGKP